MNANNPEQDCPWCGQPFEVWEYRDGTQDIECPSCERPITITVETSTIYSLVRKEEAADG